MSPITSRHRPLIGLAFLGLGLFLAAGAHFFLYPRRQADRMSRIQGLYSSLQESVYESESSLMYFLSTARENFLETHRRSYSRAHALIAEIEEADAALDLPASMLGKSVRELRQDMSAWNDAYAIPAVEAKRNKEGARLGALTRKAVAPLFFGRVKDSLAQVGLHLEQTQALYRSWEKRMERAGIAGAGAGLFVFLASLGLLLARQRRQQRLDRQQMLASAELGLFAEKLHHANSAAQAARLLAQAFGKFGGDAMVLLLESGDKSLEVKAGPESLRETRGKSPLSEDFSRCPALRTGKSLAASAKGFPCDCPLDPPACGAIYCVPLLAQGQVTGLARTRLPGEASGIPNEIEELARIFSLALDSLILLENARQEAVTDRLTGLFNRRFFEGFLEKQLQGAARGALPLSLLMLDLDRFKSVNDRHGHPAGDELLKSFARILVENTRDGDLASRFGGEEFAIVLPATGPESAKEIGERIRADTRQIPGPDPDAPVTVSIGTASFPENGTRAPELVAAADAALYQAKQAGRNRVVSAQ